MKNCYIIYNYMYFFVVFWFKNQEDENNIYTLYKKSHAYGIWKFSSVHHRGISQIFFFFFANYSKFSSNINSYGSIPMNSWN